MKTSREFILHLSAVARSNLADEAMLAALRGVLSLHEQDENEDDAYREDGDYNDTGFDRGRAQGFQEGVAQGKLNLDTVAKARDELAMKLREGFKTVAGTLTEAKRRQLAMEWLRGQLKSSHRSFGSWCGREQLPTTQGWYQVRSADLDDATHAMWDGESFIMMRKRRLIAGECWRPFEAK